MKDYLTSQEELKKEKIEFCNKLKARRLELNYTQESMAEMLGISVRKYLDIEKNCKLANFEQVKFLINFLEIKSKN